MIKIFMYIYIYICHRNLHWFTLKLLYYSFFYHKFYLNFYYNSFFNNNILVRLHNRSLELIVSSKKISNNQNSKTCAQSVQVSSPPLDFLHVFTTMKHLK